MSKKPKKERSLFHKTINWVVAVFISFLIIFILLFGFSQTQTFREYLRNTITEEVDSTINGNLSIESIEGSIFTSLKLNRVVLVSRLDTIVSANKIELHISPLQILLKKIYFRKVIGNDIKFNLIEIEPGITNLASLSMDKESEPTEIDSLGSSAQEDKDSEFPFIIQINNIELTNLAFTKKSFDNIAHNRSYSKANFDDLKLTKINLKSKILADISKSDFQLVLNNFSCETNIDSFAINSMSGAFHIAKEFAEIKKFNLQTELSNISLDIRLDEIDLFTDIDLSDFNRYPVSLNLKAKPFAFPDLARFVPNVDFLKGYPKIDLTATGMFGELQINNLDLVYEKSNFNLTGLVSNLHKPEDMFIDVEFNNSNSAFADINKLLPYLELPKYTSLNLSNFNLSYKGSPTNFSSTFAGNIGKGKLEFNSKLDFSGEEVVYDIKFKTSKLDISEVLQTKSLLTSQGKLIGAGFDPTTIEAKFEAKAFKSVLNGYAFDSLDVDLTANSKIIQLDFQSIVNNAKTSVIGLLDLTDEKSPIYNLTGSFNNLDLSKFMESDEYVSSLNFQFVTNGRGLELDEMTGEFELKFDESMIKSNYFDKAQVELILKKEDRHREIELISDFVDLNIKGDFLLEDAVDLLNYQSTLTSNMIAQKLEELNPIAKTDTLNQNVLADIDTSITNKDLEFEFEFEFKDFDLIAILIDQEELGIAGFGSGNVKNTAKNFTINSDLELDYFYTLTGKELLYLSNLETNINFTKDNKSNSFENLFGALSIGSDRIVAGSKVKNFTADFIFNQSKLIYNFNTEVDTFLTTTLDGSMKLSSGNQYVDVDNVLVEYKDVLWSNSDRLVVELKNDSLIFNNFAIYNEAASIQLNGILSGYNENSLVLEIKNLPGNLLTYYAFDLYDENFSAVSELTTRIEGTRQKPEIDIAFNINEIRADKNNLGNFILAAKYKDNNLDVRFDFLDSLNNYNRPYFSSTGNIPIYLDQNINGEVIDTNRTYSFTFHADSFDVATIGNIVPTLVNQKGFLNCNVDLLGSDEKVEFIGSLELSKITFLSTLNNLEYKSNALINFNRDEINISKFEVANFKGSRIQGKMNAKGKIKLKEFLPEEIDISLSGGLGVLGFRSRSASPTVYGNLFIEAKDDWKYTYRNGNYNMKGDILLKGMDLVYTPIQSGYNSNQDVIYEFKVDSSKIDKEELKFERLVLSKTRDKNQKSKNSLSNFDYQFNLEIEEQAKIEFILSSSFNQKLIVFADGDMRFASLGGQSSAQGQFNLRDGSKLEFFKVLDATGFIRFDANIANPYLNIVSTYNTIYKESSGSSTPIAVKINIIGNFTELGKNLTSNSENIRVYTGQRNIDDNIPDLRYDAKNALSFILIGKPNFTLDAAGGGNFAADITYEAATSFLGSSLTSLLNSRIGDAVNDIKLQRLETTQGAENFRFDVSGRIENVRYSIGGTTKNFDDINRANLKVEYLFNENFLIRAERKSAIRDITDEADKISELGLRYIFVF